MPNEVQERIISFRKKKKQSQSFVADAIGMSRSSYAYNETRARRPSREFIEKLAKHFHVSTDVLWNGVVDPPQSTLKSSKPEPKTEETPFVATHNEQKMIEMLRFLPKNKQLEYQKSIEENYLKYNVKNNE